MKKMIFLAALIFTAAFPLCTYAGITPKEPTKTSGCYNIASAENLYWFADYCKNAESTDSVYAMLTNDIVINSGGAYSYSTNLNEWEPIMDFKGKFVGDGHSITGLYVKDKEYAGLFGSTGEGATIDGVVIDRSYVEGTKYVGAVVGYNQADFLYRCVNKGTVASYTEGASTGGIVGSHNSRSNFAYCQNYGEVIGTDYTGGIMGASERSGQPLRELENYGTVRGNKYVGGIIGYMSAKSAQDVVYQCFNKGNISAVEKAGGIVGFSDYYTSSGSNGSYGWIMRSYNTVKNCYSSGWLSGANTYGIAGHNDGLVCAYNCCYLQWTANDKTVSNISGKNIGEELSAAEFASGKAAYILNSEKTPLNSAWTQDIGKDDYPCLNALDRGLVYRNILAEEYSNTEDDLHKTCRTLGNTDANKNVDMLDVIQILKKAENSEYFMPIETSASQKQPDGVYGDINGDGSVTDADASMLLDILSRGGRVDMSVGTYIFGIY